MKPPSSLRRKNEASVNRNNNLCRNEINFYLNASLESKTTSTSKKQVSTGTNAGSLKKVYTRKLKRRKGLEGPDIPQTSVDVRSAIQKTEEGAKEAQCMVSSSILEGTQIQTLQKLGRTLEDTINGNNATNQKTIPAMVPPGFDLMYNEKGIDTHCNILDKDLTSTTISSICQANNDGDMSTDRNATQEVKSNHIMEAPTQSLDHLAEQYGGIANDRLLLLSSPNAMSSQCASENNPLTSSSIAGGSQISSNQALIVKSSPFWPKLEAMDAFKKFPQQPHFRTIQGLTPSTREGSAFRLMAAFSIVFENITKSSPEDSMASFEDMSSTLHHLEENGFNVQPLQSYLTKLVQIKTHYTKCLEDEENLKAEMLEKATNMSGNNLLLDENHKAIAEIEKKLRELRYKRQQIAKEKELKDAEFARLEDASRRIKEARDNAKRRLLSILADLKQKFLR